MAPNIMDTVTKKDDNEQNDGQVKSRISSIKNESFCEKNSTNSSHSTLNEKILKESEFVPKIRWPDLIAQVFIHSGSLVGLFYLITLQAKLYTYLWSE
jgi:stearoyl-CoA desaturase (Delta-9 desaturase)